MAYKILIADDSKLVVSLITNVLSEMKSEIEIHSAQDGKEAYEKTIHILPDLILLDWQMPVKNGLETLIAIKRNNKIKDTPVVMLTGQDNLEEAYKQGAIEFIRKPFEKCEIIARVTMLMMLRNAQKALEGLKKS